MEIERHKEYVREVRKDSDPFWECSMKRNSCTVSKQPSGVWFSDLMIPGLLILSSMKFHPSMHTVLHTWFLTGRFPSRPTERFNLLTVFAGYHVKGEVCNLFNTRITKQICNKNNQVSPNPPPSTISWPERTVMPQTPTIGSDYAAIIKQTKQCFDCTVSLFFKEINL